MTDIPLANAMLCWNAGGEAKVVLHPDQVGASDAYQSSVGACFSSWRGLDDRGRKLQLMIEAWHVTAFYGVEAGRLHQALLVIPEYRAMLADDCLPKRFRHERDL